MIVYLSLGSNLDDRVSAIQQAVHMLTDNPEIRLISNSSFYESEPVGYKEQEWFVNAAAAIETTLSPEDLLNWCQGIEKKLGRVKDIKNPNGPRVIDIDILFIDDMIIRQVNLCVPHPRLHLRAFMLVPMLEVNPRHTHPLLNKSIEQLHTELKDPEEVLLYGTHSSLRM